MARLGVVEEEAEQLPYEDQRREHEVHESKAEEATPEAGGELRAVLHVVVLGLHVPRVLEG